MKKITLLFGCLILFSGAIMAQNAQPSTSVEDLLDRLAQIGTTSGNVSDYFTQEEQVILRNHFISEQEVILPAAYHNGSHTIVAETTGVTSNIEIPQNVEVPFTGTYHYNRGPNAMIYDNGPYFNIPGPPDISMLEDLTLGMSLYGFGCQFASGNSMADDFTLTDDYEINSIDLFAYQTGSVPPSITAVYVQIWDGDPSGGGASVIWGDLTTDILDNVASADAYRQLESSPGDTSREIQRVTANTTGLTLTAGTYWIEFTFNGSGASGPWAPPIAILGTTTTGNALQNLSGVWQAALDTATSAPQGVPFILYGDPVGGGGGPAEVFGINNTTANLITFDPTDPASFTTVGPSPATGFENAGAIDPNDTDTAYVLDNTGAFFSVDLTTGTYTSLGNIAAPGAETWAGAEFDPVSGTLYAISTDISTSTLSTIDIAGVSSTVVGMTGMAGAISLMIDENGDAYSHDIVDDNFYYVDLATGTASIIGMLGFDANFGQGGTYINGEPGFVYLSAFDNGLFQSQWRKVDVLTGASTVIGLFNGGSDQVAWTSSRGGTPIGIAENSLEGFVYYPNPTNGNLSLKSVNNIEAVSIYNLLGQNVLNSEIGATTADLDISNLNTGTYIMKVTVDGQTGSYKILKN